MKTPLRIVGFLVALVAVFGVAVGVGNAVDPISVADSDEHGEEHGDGHGEGQVADARHEVESLPGGLMVSQGGYTLAAPALVTAGSDIPLAFTIVGPDGHPVTAYDVEHEKQLHLIAVRRDFTGFQHVHPSLGPDGTWRTDLDLTAGTWRLFADFKPTGEKALTLGTDLTVAGPSTLVAPEGERLVSHVDDYTVTLSGDLTAGTDARLTVSFSKDGRPVTDLQPYLGAYGHFVALREGDLAYLHVHPDGTPGDGSTRPGPEVVFYAEVPSDGRYHLYLDFQHDGVVRTASFTATTQGGHDDDH